MDPIKTNDCNGGPFQSPDRCFNVLEQWTWVGCYGGYYLTSDLLHAAGFEHGFFTRRWQGRGPDELAGYLSAGASVHRPQQVHGNVVLPASKATESPWPEADGLVSDQGGQSLWVCGADCTPVLIADPDTGHASACHAGWRGVASRILPEAVSQLEALGARKDRLLVAMGPAVSGELYQVEEAVAEKVGASLGSRQASFQALEQDGIIRDDPKDGHYRLDIRRAAFSQLVDWGLQADRISLCPLCTVGEPDLFHSWRRDQVKAVQWSGIVGQAAA